MGEVSESHEATENDVQHREQPERLDDRPDVAECGARVFELELGSRGYPESAPYDAIAIHAATPEAPHSLISELGTDGRLVVPIATGSADLLTAFIRQNGDLRQETIGPCRFVPLIGAEGFRPPDPRE